MPIHSPLLRYHLNYLLIAIASLLWLTPTLRAQNTNQPWITTSPNGAGFIQSDSGNPFVVWGVNYDHANSGMLIEDYWQQRRLSEHGSANEWGDHTQEVLRYSGWLPNVRKNPASEGVEDDG